MVQFRGEAGIPVFAAIVAVRYAMLAWLVAVVTTAVGHAVRRASTSSAGGLDAALIRLCFRILSIVAALLVLLHAAGQFGVSVTPILAGLGVGGLAVALAIRPTLENIVGGFILFADKPVGVGEFCSFGDKMGTVEAVGLRSTRIRALDRTGDHGAERRFRAAADRQLHPPRHEPATSAAWASVTRRRPISCAT